MSASLCVCVHMMCVCAPGLMSWAEMSLNTTQFAGLGRCRRMNSWPSQLASLGLWPGWSWGAPPQPRMALISGAAEVRLGHACKRGAEGPRLIILVDNFFLHAAYHLVGKELLLGCSGPHTVLTHSGVLLQRAR